MGLQLVHKAEPVCVSWDAPQMEQSVSDVSALKVQERCCCQRQFITPRGSIALRGSSARITCCRGWGRLEAGLLTKSLWHEVLGMRMLQEFEHCGRVVLTGRLATSHTVSF